MSRDYQPPSTDIECGAEVDEAHIRENLDDVYRSAVQSRVDSATDYLSEKAADIVYTYLPC